MVVVLTPMSVLHHTEREIVAARLEALGLTAYGRNETEAIRACKELFNKFIHAYRARGKIAERLDHVGVEWYWEDEYPEGHPSYENTNDLLANKWVKRVQQPQNEDALYAAAA